MKIMIANRKLLLLGVEPKNDAYSAHVGPHISVADNFTLSDFRVF